MAVRFSLVAVILALACVLAAPAQAAFPGKNGKIAFVKSQFGAPTTSMVHTMEPDGSGVAPLPTGSLAHSSFPAWSPDGIRIAFKSGSPADIYVQNADGSGQTKLTDNPDEDGYPNWSPDGTRLVFASRLSGSDSDIYVMNADGSGKTRLTNDPQDEFSPAWSPNGEKIAFVRDVFENFHLRTGIFVMNPDGTEVTELRPVLHVGANAAPDWSPDNTKIVFWSNQDDNNGDIYVMNADGSGQIRLTNDPAFETDPAWSPDGTKIVFNRSSVDLETGNVAVMNPDGTGLTNLTNAPSGQFNGVPDWQPIPINSYPRPKGATPFLTYLVPAYNACASPNRVHGYPLAFASCNPPTQSSNALTVGSADSNGKPTKSVSSVRFDTLLGNPSTPADEADVKITAQVIDVYTQAGLADYAGEVTAKTTLRITDKLNTPHPGGPGAATVSDIPYAFTIPCAETADTTIGGACLLSTSADALAPGAVKEGKRSIWALGQVAVYDADNAPFMKQGIFVP